MGRGRRRKAQPTDEWQELLHLLPISPSSFSIRTRRRATSRASRRPIGLTSSLEVEFEALNEDPSPIEALTIPGVVEHYENIIGELERPPILKGHSMHVLSSFYRGFTPV